MTRGEANFAQETESMERIQRPRRLRRTPTLRRMVRETTLDPADLIAPLFIVEGSDIARPIASMPGQSQLSLDRMLPEIDALREQGIVATLLFGIPAQKDATGSSAWDPKGPVPTAIRAIKNSAPEMTVIADVCLCEYTDHGHCGVLSEGGEVQNDPTLELLARAAMAYAEAGADIVAPSAMMDGQVAAIRSALDEAGFDDTIILAYAAKFASGLYGPFREAAESAPSFGDRRAYQMDPANGREALRELMLDADEGADMLMVKPAGFYLDIVRAAREQFDLPLAAYQVSGEYAMIKAACQQGWLDEPRIVLESLTSIKRAGADLIITYFAKDVARLLAQQA
jgi:porphobilinogen synthase